MESGRYEADAGKYKATWMPYCGSGTSLASGLLGVGFANVSSQLIECSSFATMYVSDVSRFFHMMMPIVLGSLVPDSSLRSMT
jgi:hypothetical protein